MKTLLLIIVLAFVTATFARRASGHDTRKEIQMPQFSEKVMNQGKEKPKVTGSGENCSYTVGADGIKKTECEAVDNTDKSSAVDSLPQDMQKKIRRN